ncbi:glycosyltransferase [Parasphingopyxis lamellibrachiae]|nr:glycosyltransferase [Parasphingopyxis lamellibrachiae]
MRDDGLLLCDLTQSWSETGGGVGTYLRQKRAFIEENTAHQHLLIVPGKEDRIRGTGRCKTVEIASPPVPGSPNYRLLLRNRAVQRILGQLKPDIVESLDPYNLPWAALAHRKKYPQSAVVAGYRTDFPDAHIGSFTDRWFGRWLGRGTRRLSHRYAAALYSRFDGVYALNSNAKDRLEEMGTQSVHILPLGVDHRKFGPAKRDPAFRYSLGVGPCEPLLVYVGRLDREKRVMTVFEAFRRLPAEMRAHLLLIGEGKCRDRLIARADGMRVHLPGYERDRGRLAVALASSDIYVSAMPYETFGISVIEAQAAGLPIVGVASGAMPERVAVNTGMLGPVDDPQAMADNIAQVWRDGATAIGERGRRLVTNRFSWQQTFDTLLDVIYPHAFSCRDARLSSSAESRLTTFPAESI